MSTQAFIVVAPASRRAASPDAWERAWRMPLVREPAIVEYSRWVASRVRSVQLIMPAWLGAGIEASFRDDLVVHTYRRYLGDGTWGRAEPAHRASETMILDATRLPSIDFAAALAAHRRSGAAMSVFCGSGQREYCRELVRSGPGGLIERPIRHYADSIEDAEPNPVLIVLSRRTFRPDPGTCVGHFAAIADHLQTRLGRAGDKVRWCHHPALRCHATPLDALHWLIEQSAEPSDVGPLNQIASVEPGVRLHGAVRIGRDVSIGAGAVIIGPSALGDGARIGADAVVSRSIILPGESLAGGHCCHNRVFGARGEVFRSDGESYDTDFLSGVTRAIVPSFAERIRRIRDFTVSSAGLLLLAPCLAVVALAIKLTSHGPVLSRRRCQGRNGIAFDCLEFRTTSHDADALQHDPRLTRLGGWLRRTKLDKLPRLVNVLLGHMSLVGPRPAPDAVTRCCPAWRRIRLSVRPGITGLWQVARTDDRLIDPQERIHYDTQYVQDRSLWLDAQIIWQTVRILLRLGPSPRWLTSWKPTAAPPPVQVPPRRIRQLEPV